MNFPQFVGAMIAAVIVLCSCGYAGFSAFNYLVDIRIEKKLEQKNLLQCPCVDCPCEWTMPDSPILNPC